MQLTKTAALAALADALQEFDSESRLAKLRDATALVFDGTPIVPLYWQKVHWGLKDGLVDQCRAFRTDSAAKRKLCRVMTLLTTPADPNFETVSLTRAEPVSQGVVVHRNVMVPMRDGVRLATDVYPPSLDYPRGYTMNITDGIFRVRYRKGYDRPAPVAPNEGAFDITINPFATVNLFKAGHRLRLDISSSNFPKYDINFNTGEPEGTARGCRSAHNTLYLGESSVLELQILGS